MRKIVSLAAIAALFMSILSGCAAQNGGYGSTRGRPSRRDRGGRRRGRRRAARRKARRGRRRAARRARRRAGRQLLRRAGEKSRGDAARSHGVQRGQGNTPQDRAGAHQPPHGRPGRHRGDPSDLRRPHPAGGRDGPRAGEPRDPLRGQQGRGGFGRHRARGRHLAFRRLHHAPGNARPGNYRVVASVESRGGGKDIEEITFRVHP